MRFKNSPQLPGAGRTRAWHHHGSDTPTSPRLIYVLKSANGGLFYTPLYVGSNLPAKRRRPSSEVERGAASKGLTQGSDSGRSALSTVWYRR